MTMHVTDALKLARLMWPPIVRVGEVYLLADAVPPGGVNASDFPDLTAVEAFYNHVHVLDHVEHGAALNGDDPSRGFWDHAHADFAAACELGVHMAQAWRTKLSTDFPRERFRVYFTADDNPVVRFHLVRAGEPAWLDERDWAQAVAAGRVLVLDTGTPFPETAA